MGMRLLKFLYLPKNPFTSFPSVTITAVFKSSLSNDTKLSSPDQTGTMPKVTKKKENSIYAKQSSNENYSILRFSTENISPNTNACNNISVPDIIKAHI